MLNAELKSMNSILIYDFNRTQELKTHSILHFTLDINCLNTTESIIADDERLFA